MQQYINKFNLAVQQEDIQEAVTTIIVAAMSLDVSDIHIEPHETEVRIRFRIDGLLKVVLRYNPRVHPAIISRIKITSGLKIDEKRVPQDGRMNFNTYNFRVSTLPTVQGEKIVMRLASKASDIPSYEELGFQGNNLKNIQEVIKKPNGVIVVAGPTGSGKTITLYSTLKRLNKEGVNIMTIEDPVELEMPGLTQCQTNSEVGLTFELGLRAALRQDPDIIMIGEIRDHETAEVAMHAALTGHLVLSTVHTNSAIETISRFKNMGVPKFILASGLKGIVAQRLVRKVCGECKIKADLTKEIFADMEKTISSIHETEHIAPELLQDITLYRGAGCDNCNNTGFKGRLGLYEVLSIQDELISDILNERTSLDMQKTALTQGMLTLKQDGMIKALQGVTSIDEVYRVANGS